MDTPEVIAGGATFYRWPQNLAQTVLISVLWEHLPHCNPLYNRILAPQNTPSRHCLFAATFPPSATPHPPSAPPTILFADRSRHTEAQIWLFNPLTTLPSLSATQSRTLHAHAKAAIAFIRDTRVPEAPGWPFLPLLKFGCISTHLADALVAVARPFDAAKHDTNWTHFNIPLTGPHVSPLPEGFKIAPVPREQLGLVIATSSIPREAETLGGLPSVAVLDEGGEMVAWAFVDVDGSLATLFVVPGQRGKGLAKAAAGGLLGKLCRGEFRGMCGRWSGAVDGGDGMLPFGQGSAWIHSEVREGNSRSEKVVEGLGGRRCGMSRYVFIASDLIP
ncbi:hypothetical protein V493_05164 [Pseudogymnoascus sp. VKM F-4281 (FW-2241)]|nr:hypothetical protein V493_05164 [Pseudogymnoascus sp. VKM F-4281 (FW-2241)]